MRTLGIACGVSECATLKPNALLRVCECQCGRVPRACGGVALCGPGGVPSKHLAASLDAPHADQPRSHSLHATTRQMDIEGAEFGVLAQMLADLRAAGGAPMSRAPAAAPATAGRGGLAAAAAAAAAASDALRGPVVVGDAAGVAFIPHQLSVEMHKCVTAAADAQGH